MKNIEKQRLEVIRHVSQTNNVKAIERIFKICVEEDLWNDITEDDIKNIEKGIKSVEKGNYKPHSEVRKLYEKRL